MISSEGLVDSKSQEQISEILRVVWQCEASKALLGSCSEEEE